MPLRRPRVIGVALEVDVPHPLPMKLRIRAVEAHLEGDATIDDVAARYEVGSATIKLWVADFRAVGHAQPRPMGGKRHEYSISPEGERFLAELLFVVPESTLPELVKHDEAAYGVRVSDDTWVARYIEWACQKESRSKGLSYQNPCREGGPSGL